MALSSFNRAGLAGTVIGGDSYWNTLTATATQLTVDLSWPAAGGSPSSYEISINGVVENVGSGTSYSKTGLNAGTSYDFKVRPVFANGSKGGWSFLKTSTPLGFNAASGGTETTVSNYNGTGQTWKVHTFTSNGTLNVTNATVPFNVLIVGSGGGGGAGSGAQQAGGGGGGGGIRITTVSLTTGNQSVVVGASSFGGLSVSTGNAGEAAGYGSYSGAGGSSGSPTSYGGGARSGFTGGGGGGAGGAGASGDSGGGGGAGVTSNITGTTLTYANGGNGGAYFSGAAGQAGRGMPGVQGGGVIVAYRIG